MVDWLERRISGKMPSTEYGMKNADRAKIMDNMTQLCHMVQVDEISPLLRYKGVFNQEMVDDIEQYDEPRRSETLFYSVTQRGPKAFDKLIEALIETSHDEAAYLLRPETDLPRMFLSQTSSQENCDSLNSSQSRHSLKVKLSSKLRGQGSGSYASSSQRPRAYCVLVNNVDFDNEFHETRLGSDADANRLKDVFAGLGYEVHDHRNQTSTEMTSLFKNIAIQSALKDHDSLVVIILTHGDKDAVFGVDNLSVNVRDILEIFNNRQCVYLKGKPKMFFIQACRGRKYDHGLLSEFEHSFDASGFDEIRDLHVEARPNTPAYKNDASYSDMLVSYSTVYGFVSLRNLTNGSWYCCALAYVLLEKACDTELQNMLKMVGKRVHEITSKEGYKQTTSYENIGFNNDFFFNPR